MEDYRGGEEEVLLSAEDVIILKMRATQEKEETRLRKADADTKRFPTQARARFGSQPRSLSQSVTLSFSPRGISRGRSYATGFVLSQPLSRVSRSSQCLVISDSVMKT